MNKTKSKNSAAVAVYEDHPEAANGVNLLWKNGFSHKELAIMGQGYYSEDNGMELGSVLVCPLSGAMTLAN